MIEAWRGLGQTGNMVASMEVSRNQTSSYGIITPGETDGRVTTVTGLVEKPDPADAPSTLAIVGRYIIEPGVFTELSKMDRGTGHEIQITDSLSRRIGATPFHSFNFTGTRFDCGSKLGFLQANISYALDREDLSDDLAGWIQGLKL